MPHRVALTLSEREERPVQDEDSKTKTLLCLHSSTHSAGGAFSDRVRDVDRVARRPDSHDVATSLFSFLHSAFRLWLYLALPLPPPSYLTTHVNRHTPQVALSLYFTLPPKFRACAVMFLGAIIGASTCGRSTGRPVRSVFCGAV